MHAATAPLEVWQSSVQLENVVDAQFDIWRDMGAGSETFKAFQPTGGAAIKCRIENWSKERADKLYGDTPPVENLLPEQ